MGNREDLRSKWRRLLEQGEAGCNFDLDRLAPGKFCVVYRDAGGPSMPCYSEIRVTGFFEDPRDFLAFLRFADLGRILDADSDTNREPFPDVADAYLLKYEAEIRERIDHVIGLIDRALKSEMVSPLELSLIRDKFNAAFARTNPETQVLAWGYLAEILQSDCFQEAFEEDIEEEMDEDEKPSTTLKTLLDAGEFNENDEEHLVLARGFLEGLMSA